MSVLSRTILLATLALYLAACGDDGTQTIVIFADVAASDDAGTADVAADAADPDVAADAADPDVAADAADPDVAADAADPDVAADAADPDVAADTTPDVAADTTPDVAADTTPDATADTTPDATADTDAGPIGDDTTFCRELAAPTTGRCDTSPGNGRLLLRGTVLGGETAFVGGELLVSESGVIECVGCNCAASAAGATVVSCGEAVISPGLINAHDHITFTQNAPLDWGDERFDHRHDWRRGLRGHTELSVSGGASTAQIHWGELRQLLVGTTAIAGSGAADGLVRNVDRDESLLGVGNIDYSTFPLGDTGGTLVASGCAGYPNIDSGAIASLETCYHAHVAEGIDREARNEFLCVSSDANGGEDLTEPNAAFVHLIALTAVDGQELAANQTAHIWSPRSNIALYGNTAPVTQFHAQGVRIALGTDWTASGSVHILRELACADSLNQTHFDRTFTDRELWLMATGWAADALRLDGRIGRFEPGLFADIAIFERTDASPYRSVIAATPASVVAVLQSGLPMLGDAAVMAGLPQGSAGCETLPTAVCGRTVTACILRETGTSFASLSAANTSAYDLFSCSPPVDEPTCQPFRPGEYTGVPSAADLDGDGLLNAADNCPSVFNPIRPVDGGVQADADADGAGDVCDPCPLEPFATTCAAIDPDDRDGDGVRNAADNCPATPNAGQENRDGDDLGDVCDPCPDAFGLGGTCPVSIPQVKTDAALLGSVVRVEGVVTAVSSRSFWMQVPDIERASPDHSGLYVYYDDVRLPQPEGTRIAVTGTVQDFFGQTQLALVSDVEVLDAGPVLVSPTALTPLQATEPRFEGILATVSGTVTDTAPLPGIGDSAPTNEFELDGTLRVNDLVYLTTPFPIVGDSGTVTGALRFANTFTKLEPRRAADVDLFGGVLAPVVSVVSPNPIRMAPSSTLAVTVRLNVAPVDAAVSVNVSVSGGIASAPLTTFGIGQQERTITFLSGPAVGESTARFTTPNGTLEVPLFVSEPTLVSGLVLSEVYYDAPSGDDQLEWVELYNGGATSVSLTGLSLAYGGNDWTFGALDLSGTLPAGGCFVVGGPSSTFDNGSPLFDLVADFNPDIQNSGTAADAVGLFAVPASLVGPSTVPVDLVVYGETNTAGFPDASGGVAAVDVGDAVSGQSIARVGGIWQIGAPTPGVCSVE